MLNELKAKIIGTRDIALKLDIGFFGDGMWAVNSVEKLVSDPSFNIRFIVVRWKNPDNKLIELSKRLNIPYFCVKSVNSSNFLNKIAKFNCNIFVSVSFDQIFKKDIINMTQHKFINCHAGKLPFYRGRNVLNWVLINDEKEFGITVHFIDEGIDTGDIILQRFYEITDNDSYKTILEKSFIEIPNLLYDALKIFSIYEFESISQKKIHPVGFYCTTRIEGDEIINWNQSSREIFNFIRAVCHPGPIATSFINGKPIKINKASLIDYSPQYIGIPGAVVGISENGFIVKTKDSSILVNEYYYDDKIKIGDRLK